MQVMAGNAVVFSQVPPGLIPEILDAVDVRRARGEAIV
jgi:hypothetical protein